MLRQMIADRLVGQVDLQATLTATNQRLALQQPAFEQAVDRITYLEHRLGINTTKPRSPDTGTRLANIPELIEVVLLYLPTRDLLLAQRVNKSFNEIIDKSPNIQRSLFFVPEAIPETYKLNEIKINPLLIDPRSFVRTPLYRNQGERHHGWPIFLKGAQLNIKKLMITGCEVARGQDHGWNRATIALSPLPAAACRGAEHEMGSSARGSWRKMYFTQPPIKIEWAHTPLGTPHGNSYTHAPIQRFGELFEWKKRLLPVGPNDLGDADYAEVDASSEDEA